jgi:hypothetical protein
MLEYAKSLKENLSLRLEEAEKVGIGFALPAPSCSKISGAQAVADAAQPIENDWSSQKWACSSAGRAPALQAAEITPNPLSKFTEREGDDMAGQNEIRRRAYEIYLEYGEQPGGELDDWLRAEREFNKALVLEAIDTLFNQRDYVKA